MGLKVSKKQLAETFGISERTLTEWQAKGMPIEIDSSRGHQNVYDTAACIEWRIAQIAHGGRESARDRKDRVSADFIELQIAEKSGQLVQADEVALAWSNVVLGCRAILMNMADRLKTELDATYGIDVDAELINAHVHDALTKLAEIDAPDNGAFDAGDDETIRSTVENDNDAMG